MKVLKCKLCGASFDERPGLPGLRCCQACDDNGRSGICKRATVYGTKDGRENATIHYLSPGV